MEDDEDVRDSLRDVLESDGFAVETVADGSEGLAFLRNHEPPSVILLDLMTPKLSGFQVLDILRYLP